jgi:hypothetical protein
MAGLSNRTAETNSPLLHSPPRGACRGIRERPHAANILFDIVVHNMRCPSDAGETGSAFAAAERVVL